MAKVPETARRDFLVEVAKLYYEQDLSQAEIAGRFNVSRSLVSHLLKLSREQGIVEIRINDPRSRAVLLQQKLCARFDLASAVVVPSGPDANDSLTSPVTGPVSRPVPRPRECRPRSADV